MYNNKKLSINYIASNLTNMCQEQFFHDARYCIFGNQEKCPLELKSCDEANIEIWKEYIRMICNNKDITG